MTKNVIRNAIFFLYYALWTCLFAPTFPRKLCMTTIETMENIQVAPSAMLDLQIAPGKPARKKTPKKAPKLTHKKLVIQKPPPNIPEAPQEKPPKKASRKKEKKKEKKKRKKKMGKDKLVVSLVEGPPPRGIVINIRSIDSGVSNNIVKIRARPVYIQRRKFLFCFMFGKESPRDGKVKTIMATTGLAYAHKFGADPLTKHVFKTKAKGVPVYGVQNGNVDTGKVGEGKKFYVPGDSEKIKTFIDGLTYSLKHNSVQAFFWLTALGLSKARVGSRYGGRKGKGKGYAAMHVIKNFWYKYDKNKPSMHETFRKNFKLFRETGNMIYPANLVFMFLYRDQISWRAEYRKTDPLHLDEYTYMDEALSSTAESKSQYAKIFAEIKRVTRGPVKIPRKRTSKEWKEEKKHIKKLAKKKKG